MTAHFVTLSKNSRHDKWTLSLRRETRPAVSILVNFSARTFMFYHNKSPCCQRPTAKGSRKPRLKLISVYGKIPFPAWKEWQSFDGSTNFYLKTKAIQGSTSWWIPAELSWFFFFFLLLLEFSNWLSYFQLPLALRRKIQIINSEVRSISPQTPPAGLTEVS